MSLTSIDYRQLELGDNLLQSGFWGAFKAKHGWIPRGYSWEFQGREYRFLLLERRFLGGLSIAYIPYGPQIPPELNHHEASSILTGIGMALRRRLSRGCFMVRFDLGGEHSKDEKKPDALEWPLCRSPYRVQPQDTVILSLNAEEATLLARMHKKTRYNIRLAKKRGVEIHRHSGEEALNVLPLWYALYRETALRNHIALHTESYYRTLIQLSMRVKAPLISLYTAHHENEVLGGIIVAHLGSRSLYMYGASSNLKRKLMPNYLLQWQAILDAQGEGALEYDFFGIPPTDDPSHPMHGLMRFKTGFGGEIRHYLGAWDFPIRKLIYRLYRPAEALRGWLVARKKRSVS